MDNSIIFIAGLGATGSSAIIDLLKEVNSYFVLESEFRLFVDPGGLINLQNALVDNWSVFQTDVAIRNFLRLVKCLNNKHISPYSTLGHNQYFGNQFIIQSKKFVKEILDFEYRGLWYGIDTLIKRKLNRIPFLFRNKLITKPIFVGKNLSDDEFNAKTDKYIKALVNYTLSKNKKRNFCFNENFSCMFPFKILNMVKDSKMILVIRDPKDVLATAKENRWAAAPGNIENFLNWELAIYNRWLKIEKYISMKDPEGKMIKVIKFEDLILNYDETIKLLFDFFNVKESEHIYKKRFLIPEKSRRNVGLWRSILKPEEIKIINKTFSHFYKKYGYSV